MTQAHPIPMGTRIPESIHAVSVSMPTMADVIGYEEGEPGALAKIRSGYPRFVVHPFLREIERHWQELFAQPDKRIWPTASPAMARRLEAYLACPEAKFLKHGGVAGLRLPPDPELNLRARKFLQHVGGFLSSRQAEDYLLRVGRLEAAQREDAFAGDSAAEVKRWLAPLCRADPGEIVLANSGMNAALAAFEAVNRVQAPRGRHAWINLGWLYVDTLEILAKLSRDPARNASLYDVFDLDALERLLEKRPGEFAGILTETPTNPLIQTMDLARLRALARKHGVLLVVDPTVNSAANVDVAPYADILTQSLTKYAASEGDVILGALSVGPEARERAALLEAARSVVEPPYPRDLGRLARQIGGAAGLIEAVNRNALRVAAFLETHPQVDRVWWALEPRSRDNYLALARREDAVGSMISFTVKGPLEAFYDRLALAKGPSFGMRRSLICPFVYLAHYDLVRCEEGRGRLRQAGIDPDLLRLSVGAEPAEEIVAALEKALDGRSGPCEMAP